MTIYYGQLNFEIEADSEEEAENVQSDARELLKKNDAAPAAIRDVWADEPVERAP